MPGQISTWSWIAAAFGMQTFSSAAREQRRLRAGLVVAAILFACFPIGVHAQQGTGSIAGKVIDATGAVIPDATITITNQATLSSISLKSDAGGEYSSPPLTSGQYMVEVERDGFRPAVQKDFALDNDQHAQLDFTLQVGDMSQQVEVQANAPALNTFNASLGSVLDNSVAESLPLNGSSALSLIQLDPSVISAFGPVNEGFNDRGTGVSNIRIGGGVSGSNANLLDGANNLQTTRGEVLINSTVTGIQETRLMYGVVSAQYGLTSGGVIAMTTKSGTNNFHGQVYEYFRNTALNAVNHFAAPGTRPAIRYNQYGAALGGPIMHDRAFVFGNYEAYRNTQVNPSIATVPTLLERGGDFSDQPAIIYNPDNVITGTICSPPPNQSQCLTNPRVAYANNKITSFDKAALAFQEAFVPKPNLGGPGTLVNNYASDAPLISSQTAAIGRIDWQINNRLSFFGRYAYYENITNNEGNYGSLPLAASTRNDDLRNQDVTLGLTKVVSGTMLNDIRVAVGRSYFPFAAGSTGGNWPQKLGISSSVPSTTLPAISIANYGIQVSTNTGLRTSLIPEINDTLTILHGLHSIHVGAGARFYEAYNSSNAYPSGSFSFSQSVTGQVGSSSIGTGNSYASFLIGKPGSVTATVAGGSVARSFSVNGFVQDDWRVLPSLTVNLGIRYDYQAIPWEKANGFSTLRLDQIYSPTPVPGSPGLPGLPGREVYANGNSRNFEHENYHDFGPRVGFAWQISSRHHTVLRGGYALYYASAVNQVNTNATDGFGTNTTNYESQSTYGYISQFSDGFPYTPLGLPRTAGGTGMLLGQSPTVQPVSAPTPASQQFALSLNHEFAGKTIVTISLIQNHGTHFPMTGINLNQLSPQNMVLGQAALESPTTNPYSGYGIKGSFGGKNLQVRQALAPYPYFSRIYEYYPHFGGFLGRGAQIVISRPISANLQMQLGYSRSKLLSDPLVSTITAPATVQASLQNNYAPHSEYGIDPTDVTNRYTGNLTYGLPFGARRTFFNHASTGANRWISGWSVASTFTIESGRPLAITGTNNNTATRPNFVPGVNPKLPHPNVAEWFNTTAFTVAPPYTFGNVPRTLSTLRGPGAFNLNLNLSKITKINRYTGEFRLDAFNAINKTNLGNPNVNYVAPNSTTTVSTGANGLATAFGTITSAQSSRNMQITVKLRF
ncbi:MAG TPA: TonB-dependent receptor [Acidobacteriaceae bacterium]